jgi:pyruvate/2-oxoglutarate dehydrogenase complex dihydrolipoamide acyltransferase (E2) component
MDISKLKTSELRQVITLVEKREKAEAALAAIDQQIKTLLGGGGAAPAPKAAAKAKKPAKKARRKTAKPAKAASSAKAPAKDPKAPKAAQPVKPAAAKGKPKVKRARGEMKKLVLGALEKVGPEGLTVKELSTALKIPSQNIHVWFSSTGKKLPGVGKNDKGRWTYKKD